MLTADDIQVVPRCACYLLWATFQRDPRTRESFVLHTNGLD